MLTLNAGDGLRIEPADGALVGRFGDVEVRLACARWSTSLPPSDVLGRVADDLVRAVLAALIGTAAAPAPSSEAPAGDLFPGAQP